MSDARKFQRAIADLACELGWQMSFTAKRHIRLERTGCQPVITSSTPRSAERTLNNVRAMLRRAAAGRPT